jgi:hypothetical protein
MDYADNQFSLDVRMLAALAFVAPHDVIRAFESVVQSDYADRCEPIVAYLEDNLIEKLDSRGKRKQPTFSIAFVKPFHAPTTASKNGITMF